MSKDTFSVAVDEDLREWADDNHGRLGYTSRSALVNDLLARCRQQTADDSPETLLTDGGPYGPAETNADTDENPDQ